MNNLLKVLVCLSFSSVLSKPASSSLTETEFTSMTFTLARLNAVLTAYKQYKEFIPSYIYDPIDALTDAQKTSIVNLVNDYHAGGFAPKNYQELAAVVKANYSDLYDTMNTMYNTYQEHVAKLGPKGQAYAADVEAKLYADADPDRIVWACHLFNNAQSVVSQAKALLNDQTEADAIEDAFPEAVSFLNSKEFSAYAIVVDQLKPLDCVKDREQIFNTIKLFDMHNVLTSKDSA
ncbi:unnamed protein product [Caenorhabditis angaria]|uniref:Uncharacterized protein n=1 Tax=Caenorhabditis angaria TaxID=860376 RepID=A0A9P1N1T3_9PELO|nr:unnamed protein product [Caenorhabditis angaria]